MTQQSDHDIIAQRYEVAASPETHHDYMRSLSERICVIKSGAALCKTDADKAHLIGAAPLVDVITPCRLDTDSELHQQLALRMQAMLAVNATGNIVEANTAAKTAYDLKSSSTLMDLPISAGDSDRLLIQVQSVVNRGSGAHSTRDVTRLTNSSSGSSILVTLELYNSKKNMEQLVIVKTSDIGLPSHLHALLRDLFKLSDAEIEVIQLMVEGYSVAEIAHRRCSSVPTVRSQLSSIFSKTDTKTQMDCVRMVFGLALMQDNRKGNSVATRIQDESGSDLLSNRGYLHSG